MVDMAYYVGGGPFIGEESFKLFPSSQLLEVDRVVGPNHHGGSLGEQAEQQEDHHIGLQQSEHGVGREGSTSVV